MRISEFVRRTLKGSGSAPAPAAASVIPVQPLSIEMTTDKTNYHRGDLMRVTVKTNRDAFVRLTYQDAEGKSSVLLPNAAHDGRVSGGVPVVFGDDTVINPTTRKAFRIRIGAPFGREVLSAVASDQPLRTGKGAELEIVNPTGAIQAGAAGSIARTELITEP